MFLFHVDFNPLPRKEGDVGEAMKIALAIDFNPLPRKEGDCAASAFGGVNNFYFNPLPLFQNFHVTENAYNAINSAI